MTASTDPSSRYVLPDDAPYLKNLAALWLHDRKLAAAIEATDDTPSYTVDLSKSGAATLAVELDDGRRLQMHSRYDPKDEATKLVDAAGIDEAVAFHVHGFGLGYHVAVLMDRCGDETIVCVFEPDLLMLRTAFESCDYSAQIETGRLMFFTELDKVDLQNRLQPQTALITLAFRNIDHAPSVERAPEFHAQFKEWIAEFEAYCRTTINTLVLNGRRTAENVTMNLPWYVASPSLSRLENAYRNQPAIIVSAGPSLRKNKHLLPSAAGKAVMISVQTTLQPMLEIGVEPNFVTSLDYHDICTRFFEKLPAGLKTELVAEPKATNKIFDLMPGPVSLLGNDFAENLLAEMKPNRAKLPSGATVAHLAYYLAEHLGCNPIIFVGQDLGFSDGLCYSPGTSYDDVWRPELSRFCTVEMKQWEQIVREKQILRRVPDHAGRPMYTEERLFTYLQQFEKDFAATKTKIIDATEGGVLKRGATSMTLADAIDQYCRNPLPTIDAPHHGADWSATERVVQCLRTREDEARRIEEVSMRTLPLLEEVRDFIDDQPRVNRVIGRIDALRQQMNALGSCYLLIMQLSQKTELDRFRADRMISAIKAEGLEKQRRQTQRDIANVQSVIEAARDFQELMRKAIASFGDHGRTSDGRSDKREAA